MIRKTESFELAYRFVTQTNANIFLTGKAGTGKTTFLKYLRANTIKNVVVAAPTGVAAINAGGVTLHSLFQLPFAPYIPHRGEESALHLRDHGQLSQIHFHANKLKVLRSMDLLVIDEVSMVAANTLDAIDAILRSVRRNRYQPFGGVQVLFIGDLHQLPPVVKPQDWEHLREHYSTPFFFHSYVLRRHVPVMIELKTIFRQNNPEFVDILNQIRHNELSPANLEKLNARMRPGFRPDEKEGYISLTTHNAQADSINREKLAACTGKPKSYKAKTDGDFPEHMYPAEAELHLKEGAQVMFLKNDTEEKRYFNGKIGKVSRLTEDEIFVRCDDDPEEIPVKPYTWKNIRYKVEPVSKEVGEEELGSFVQYPLRLAWAITIHKSQGLTFQKLVVDAENAFQNGQVYVALSRCTSLEGLVLTSPINRKFLGGHHDFEAWEAQTQQEETLPQKLENAKQEFIRTEIKQIYRLNDLVESAEGLQQFILSNKSEMDATTLDWLSPLLNTLRSLQDTSMKFLLKVDEMSNAGLPFETNERLKQRVKDAAVYFTNALEAWTENLRAHPLRIRKKKTAQEADAILGGLIQLSENKRARIGLCLTGFSPESYIQDARKLKEETPRFLSAFADDKAARKEAAEKADHADLFDRLLSYRNQKADELDVEVHRIINRKALLEISNILPGDNEALGLAKGMGKARIKDFGADILGIVRQYCDENGLETKNLSAEIGTKVPRKKHKKADNGNPSWRQSLELFHRGMDAEAIARERNCAVSTVENHLATAISEGALDISEVMVTETYIALVDLIDESPRPFSLRELKEKAGDKVSYTMLKYALAARNHAQAQG